MTPREFATERTHLGFSSAAQRAFAFMRKFGFHELESSPTIIRYANGDLIAQVYHGRRSYEIGFEIGRGDQLFAASELLRATNSASADQYRNRVALTPEAVASGVDQLAKLVQKDGVRALQDDEEFFELLREQRVAWGDAFSMDVRVRQLRPQAETAFREERYREAAELYEKILPRLTAAERIKLNFARRRSGDPYPPLGST